MCRTGRSCRAVLLRRFSFLYRRGAFFFYVGALDTHRGSFFPLILSRRTFFHGARRKARAARRSTRETKRSV
jgi:hypothetical protein